MSTYLPLLKRLIPPALWRPASQVRYALDRVAQWPAATFHPWRRKSLSLLGRYHNLHRGQRCFIIGNGPSLRQTDLSKLKREFTFGLNRIYLAFDQMGFLPTYYVSVNDLVIEQCLREILALPMPKFLSWRSRRFFTYPPDETTIFLHTTHTGPKFAADARERLWEGATVTYVALQLAYYMGFQRVILVGVDHSFSTQGKPNTTVVSQGEDRDHFHASYFGKGFRWQLPDLETSERAYRMAKEAFERAGREVLDATIGGKLQVFPKVDYEKLFDEKPAGSK
ncbi:MAG: DUF115 domain-containing protein [Anaerolineales bacterium]|nr:DUF115 domain-containing protein [Anaerolineales bacterium]MDW8446387.1 DUF115 domain-containing protein [Anaerolineales bacterium]